MRPTSSRTAKLLAVVVAASALANLAFVEVAASATVVTTTSLLSAAKAAIAKQTAVHLVDSSKSGSSGESVIADLGKTNGTETITDGKAIATIKVTPTYAYLGASSSGFTTLFGLTAAQAKKVGKEWISMKVGTSQYSDLKSGTTVSGVTAALPAAKGTTLSKTLVDNKPLFVLKWTTAATSSTPKVSTTLTISAVGVALPVQETATTSSGRETTTFSKWGEHVVVSSPPAVATISYAKVTG